MYICTDCGHKFSKAEKITETHGLSSPPYEEISVCPACKSENFHKQNYEFCRFCGARLKSGAVDYCSEKCRRRGTLARLKEKRRKKHIADSDIYRTVRRVEIYNHKHGTRYSYGQYTALIEGKDK